MLVLSMHKQWAPALQTVLNLLCRHQSLGTRLADCLEYSHCSWVGCVSLLAGLVPSSSWTRRPQLSCVPCKCCSQACVWSLFEQQRDSKFSVHYHPILPSLGILQLLGQGLKPATTWPRSQTIFDCAFSFERISATSASNWSVIHTVNKYLHNL